MSALASSSRSCTLPPTWCTSSAAPSKQLTQTGSLNFGHHRHSMKIEDVMSIFKKGMSLTMIGKDKNDKPEVVWLFDQENGLKTWYKTEKQKVYA